MHPFIQTIGAIAMLALSTSSAATADIQTVNPTALYDPTPNGYSHAMIAGHLAFIAGQGGETKTGELAPDFEAQVAQAYRNLKAALDAVGVRPDQVVKLTTYVVDHDQSKLAVLTRHLTHTFGSHLPTQTLVPVPRLALDGMLFEIDAVAVLSNAPEPRQSSQR